MARLQKKAGGSHHRYEPDSRPSLRDGFTAYSVLSPGTGFLAPVFDDNASHHRIRDNTSTHCAGHQHRDARTTRLDRAHRIVRRHGMATLQPDAPTASRAQRS